MSPYAADAADAVDDGSDTQRFEMNPEPAGFFAVFGEENFPGVSVDAPTVELDVWH